MSEIESSRGSAVSQRLVMVVGGIVSMIVLLALGYYLFARQNSVKTQISEDDTQALLEIIGTHVPLPDDEEPTIATVTDREKLQDQAFFRLAEVGDRVVIYPQSERAILYRPSIDKIIEYSPIAIRAPEATESASRDVQTLSTVLANGTDESGLAASFEERIARDAAALDVVDTINASGSYDQSMLVVLTAEYESQARALADALGIKVGEMPDAEQVPDDIDVLIILGDDMIP